MDVVTLNFHSFVQKLFHIIGCNSENNSNFNDIEKKTTKKNHFLLKRESSIICQ